MMEKYCRTIMLQPYYFLPREQKKNITRKVDTIWVLHYVLYILRMERPRNMIDRNKWDDFMSNFQRNITIGIILNR